MKAAKIDFSTWPRKDLFRYYTEEVNMSVNLTAETDVTDFVRWCKTRQLRFYPSFIYVVSRVMNAREEFRVRYDEKGNIVLWDEVYPSFTDFHKEDESFVRLISRYSPDFKESYKNVTDEMELHKDKRGFDVAYQYSNTFDVSCLPWIHYNYFGTQVSGGSKGKFPYLSPVISWGKYAEKNGRLMLPLGIHVHHGIADGYHAARFFSDVDKFMAELVNA